MTQESCRNYLLCLNSADLLTSMAKSVTFEVSINTKMILSSLSSYLPSEYQSSFRMTTEELTTMLDSLDILLERGISEGELFFSVLEIIRSFKFFIQFEPNRELLAYSTVYKSIGYLLQRGNTTEQRMASELLWKLVTKPMSEDAAVVTTKKKRKAENVIEELNPHEYMSEPSIRLFLLQNYPEIFAILLTLSTESGGMLENNKLFSCTFLVLMKESEEVIGKGMCMHVIPCLGL